MIEYTHPALNEEITAIGGHFVLVKEERLIGCHRPVLYHVGYAVVDSSCCGVGGAAFASVAGYVLRWRHTAGPGGRIVSLVEPVTDAEAREKIKRMIREKEFVHQVDFL